MQLHSYIIFLLLFVVLSSCENDINEVNRLFSRDETLVETATGVELLYSDSALLKLRIVSPKLLRHLDKKDPYQEFPDGLTVEFFGPDGQTVTGRMTAKWSQIVFAFDGPTPILTRVMPAPFAAIK